jgi:hypothetical protein
MRLILALGAIGLTAAPAAAQSRPPAAPPAAPAPVLPPEIADGRVLDDLGNMMGALSKALLNLPVGELEAAVENRPATRADRSRTVRSVTGMDERELDRDIESSKVAVKSGGEALARALPVVVEALNKAGDDIARATANMPQPGYPRR